MTVSPILLVFVLFARTSHAGSIHLSFQRSSSEIPPSPRPSPRPVPDRDPTHISDFTDPDTGLNPFLDLQEGRTGAFGRRVMEQDRPAPKPPLPNFDVVEGGSEERGRPGGMFPGNRRWKSGRNNATEDAAGPRKSAGTQRSHMEPAVKYPRQTFDFSAFTEANTFFPPEETTTLHSEESTVTPTSTTTADIQRTTFADVKHVSFDDVAHVTSTPENPFFATNATISALVTGAAVAVLALVAAACWKWRSNRTRTHTQPSDVESADRRNCEEKNDKQNGSDSLLGKT